MLRHKDHFHGSDLEKIEELYKIPKEKILSFSGNVNPLGMPKSVLEYAKAHLDCLSAYPDREYKDLKRAIAAYADCPEDFILTGSGSSELITHFMSKAAPKRALIIGPTYSEYERAVIINKGTVKYFPLREEEGFSLNTEALIEKLESEPSLLVLCNPNNPTGTNVSTEELRRILNVCMEHGVFLLIDETYIEFAEDPGRISAVPLTQEYENLAVLRGTSKFFALPGLRLGYMITQNRELYEKFHSTETPWTVNSLAAALGPVMFRDRDYIEKTRALIHQERERLYSVFKESRRFSPIRPTANFMMLKVLDPELNSGILFEKCIREAMMIRDLKNFPFLSDRFIRLCFLMPEQNDRLLSLLLN